LLVPDTVGVGGNLESAPFFVIQDRSKDAGRVKVWVAVPVDRTVHAHQRNCAHVADDSVIFDRLIRHCSISFLFVSVFFVELTSFAKRMRYKQFAVSKLLSFPPIGPSLFLSPSPATTPGLGLDRSPVSDQASARAFAGADLASGKVGHALISVGSSTAK
jgi:hypothetical protein